MRNIKKKLRDMRKNTLSKIERAVINDCLTEEDPADFIKGVLSWGCKSGYVRSLIYYSDTHKFYDKYYEDIEELREDYEQSTGAPLRIDGDLKNCLAWFGFEETLYRIAVKLGFEI